jgi:histidinol dehydrogenase
VDDFLKKSSYIYYDKKALEKVGCDVATFARSEGLQAHARSVEIRLERNRI